MHGHILRVTVGIRGGVMNTQNFSSDYFWDIIDVQDSSRTCKGCKRRDEVSHACDSLDTIRSDDDIACENYEGE